MPRWITWTLMLAATVALIPFACVARSRAMHSESPRIHIIQDMDGQPKYKSQTENPLFVDGRSMRRAVAGTVARGALDEDDHLHRGLVGGNWAEAPPLAVTPELMARGRTQYGIFCSPCHGLSGHGDGPVAVRADKLQEGTWVPPASLHVEPTLTRPDGHIFNTITNGIRTMPPYADQISPEDRWAVVAYVRALQTSQGARIDQVPDRLRPAPR